MKRTLAVALLGAALTIPMEAEAQRVRPRGDNVRVERQVDRPARAVPRARRPAAIPGTGRLAACQAPRNGRAYVCAPHRRVVYRSSSYLRSGRNRYVWADARWARVTMRLPVRRARFREIRQNRLRDLIGTRAVNRIRAHGRAAGLRGGLRGHWLDTRRFDDILVLTMGGREVARLVDYDRDGFVDDVLLRDFYRAYRTW